MSRTESQPNKAIQELSQETTLLIAKIARKGIRELSALPHFDNFGIVRPNPRKQFRYEGGHGIIHSTSSTTVAPRDYNAPHINGLDHVVLNRIFLEQDIVRFRAFKSELFHLPDLPITRFVSVELQKDQGYEKPELGDPWQFQRYFRMSTKGRSEHPFHRAESPAILLAAAGLVAQSVKQAQLIDIGVTETESLYGDWLQNDESTPRPQAGQPVWSIFNER